MVKMFLMYGAMYLYWFTAQDEQRMTRFGSCLVVFKVIVVLFVVSKDFPSRLKCPKLILSDPKSAHNYVPCQMSQLS